ncbi:unnamed protein product [Mytilus edulis]|uniref:Uncharacterized protein n=1 Tax=Mytilus edulis TaxID=6550 RepID=A0A8S3RFH5_MYTED|nr:unnamed protein product [Mytilus edulis]
MVSSTADFFRTKNFIIQYTTGDGKDSKEKLVSSEYLNCSILLDSSAKFIQLTICTEIKKSIRSVPSSEVWIEIKHFKEKTLRMESSPSSLVDKSVEIMEERTITSDDTEETLDTCEHVPVDNLVEIDKESTVVSGLSDKDDTEDTLDMETCEHVPVDKLVKIDKESTVVSRSFDKDKTNETDHMETSHLSLIDKSVEIEDGSTIFSDKTEEILHMETSQIRPIDKYVEMENESTTDSGSSHLIGRMSKLTKNRSLKRKVHDLQIEFEEIQTHRPILSEPDMITESKSPVDLSRLFLQTHMAHFTAFDESCDSPALLGIIGNIDRLPVIVQADAEKIRSDVQNHWINCVFTEWTEIKYDYAFKSIRQLISNLRLSNKEENRIKGKLHSLAKMVNA